MSSTRYTNLIIDRSRSYKQSEDFFVEVFDLDFASYLLMNNIPLAQSYRNGKEFMFKFYDKESKIPSIAIAYANSESAKFADCVRRLKKVTIAQQGFKPLNESNRAG